jgi:hypothetical protein
MSSDAAGRVAVEAEGGIFRLLRHPFDVTHKELYGEDAAVNEATARVVVQHLKADPELARAFAKPKPMWEELEAGGRSAKVAFISEFGVDEYLRLSREGHARAKAKGPMRQSPSGPVLAMRAGCHGNPTGSTPGPGGGFSWLLAVRG